MACHLEAPDDPTAITRATGALPGLLLLTRAGIVVWERAPSDEQLEAPDSPAPVVEL